MANRQYRTLRGKLVDMDLLQKKNELTPAVGNSRVNARGDELGPGGKIVKKREDRVKEYYGANVAQESTGRAKRQATPTVEAPQPKVAPDPIAEDVTPQELEQLETFDEEQEWIEDENGNFYRKGDR